MDNTALALALFTLGILLILAGMLLLAFPKGGVKAGGAIFLGPIPIPFGDPKLAFLGVVLGLLLFLFTLLWR